MKPGRINLKKQVAIEPTKQGLARFEAAVAQAVKKTDEVKADRWEVQSLITSATTAKVGGLHPINPEGGAFEVRIPRPATEDEGREILLINITSSINTVTLKGVGCTVRGVAAPTLSAAYWSQRLVAYDGNWWVA